MYAQTGVIRDPEAPLRPGFTLIELVLVLVIGGILAAVAIPPVSSYLQNRHMIQARDAFIMMAAQARAAAMEEGDYVLMTVSPDDDDVVVTRRDGTVLHTLDFTTGRTTDLLGDAEITICYTPRGFAHPACLDGGELPETFGFTSGGDTVQAQLTLGRARPQ